jgi:hypothetical protein
MLVRALLPPCLVLVWLVVASPVGRGSRLHPGSRFGVLYPVFFVWIFTVEGAEEDADMDDPASDSASPVEDLSGAGLLIQLTRLHAEGEQVGARVWVSMWEPCNAVGQFREANFRLRLSGCVCNACCMRLHCTVRCEPGLSGAAC